MLTAEETSNARVSNLGLHPEAPIEQVKRHYGRVLRNNRFYEAFYDLFTQSHPGVRDRFNNTDMAQQMKLLRHGVNLMIMFADGNMAGEMGLSRIKASHGHGQLNIAPVFYQLWKRAFLQALRTVDPKAGQELIRAWSQVLDQGIAYVQAGYGNGE